MFFAVALAIVVFSLAYMCVTLVLARRKVPVPAVGQEPQLVVFVVPALNEVTVIKATLRCLLSACGERGRVLVIDDGSDDGTGEIIDALRVAHFEHLWVLKRCGPIARQGKGQALNAAYSMLRARVAELGIDSASVVLGIIDADGRITRDVVDVVAPYFRDPAVGALQLLVRIRNRSRLLSRFQDYEFTLFSALTQTAREHVGSVGLGGNGQFTRLAALASLGDEPWTHCLTEDLDLGVRLAIAGWTNRFCGETFVDQQGLNNLRLLLRQRTRWAQGHFQCWRLIPRIVASQLPTLTVLDLCYYLMAPAVSLIASVLFTVPLLWGLAGLAIEPSRWLTVYGVAYFAVLYLMSFIPSMLMSVIYWRRSQDLSLMRALMLGNLLVAYNYIWYAAQWKALARIVTRRGTWAKTTRTVEDVDPIDSTVAFSHGAIDPTTADV